jgi:transcription elongation factor GreA
MTPAGFERMQAELKHLKTVERPSVIKAIAEARAHGDLSENAEYHAAKEKQGFIEGRILELEDKVGRAEVINLSTVQLDKIQFGATVTVLDEDNQKEHRYQIVGADESDIKLGRLSVTAPLAKALIGKKVDDFLEISTPSGGKAYSVIKIEYV